MAKQETRSITTLPGPEKEISKPVSEMMSLSEAAAILAIHRTTAWSLYRRGEFPVPVLKVGGNLRVVRVHLQQFLDTGQPVTLPFRASSDSRSIAS